MNKPNTNILAPSRPFVRSSLSRRICKKCGARSVIQKDCSGRTVRYRNIAALAIPAEVSIPVCTRCHASHADTSTQAELLSREYRAALRCRAQVTIKRLSQYVTQRKLEALLGMSQGYLSRLRSGAGTPSPELVSLLALLAQDPKTRIQELELYWNEERGEGERCGHARASSSMDSLPTISADPG